VRLPPPERRESGRKRPPGGPRSKGGKETDISKRSIYPGFKSPHTNYSRMKRKGSALLRSRVRNSRVSATSPKRKRTIGGLVSRRHSRWKVEARVEETDRVIMVGMAANALFCDRGRPLTVLRPGIIERPDTGILVEGSRGITERESRSNAVRGVGWTHSARWAARWSGGFKSLWRSDEGRHIQRRGENPRRPEKAEIRRAGCLP